ncbi:hypothetical protein PFNF135_02048 [Plasmodium falciparum NF135/5.C10]|uniref:Uncharacterized protein n=1 Tax=Plasmodium falciparum NF135/5.C10 TaxID=1036726 RepID=W4IIN0_PLAFA|nr:hypothetical protein PFNF135_02048 [Plasmodium falciparum NF135/5.C10]
MVYNNLNLEKCILSYEFIIPFKINKLLYINYMENKLVYYIKYLEISIHALLFYHIFRFIIKNYMI